MAMYIAGGQGRVWAAGAARAMLAGLKRMNLGARRSWISRSRTAHGDVTSSAHSHPPSAVEVLENPIARPWRRAAANARDSIRVGGDVRSGARCITDILGALGGVRVEMCTGRAFWTHSGERHPSGRSDSASTRRSRALPFTSLQWTHVRGPLCVADFIFHMCEMWPMRTLACILAASCLWWRVCTVAGESRMFVRASGVDCVPSGWLLVWLRIRFSLVVDGGR